MDQTQVLNVTGSSCSSKGRLAADLNLPSITLSSLMDTRTIIRTVTNVAENTETYTSSYEEPAGISMQVTPQSFTIEAGKSVALSVALRVNQSITGEYSFGSLLLSGDRRHLVRIPLAIRARTH